MRILSLFKEKIDMTVGNPTSVIVLFMVPMLLGNVAQQLYNTVDSIIVGKFIGDDALSAVGSVGSIFNLVLVLFIGISVGASILVSQYFGAKDKKNISSLVGTTIIMTAVASVMIMILGPFISRPLLEMLKTPVQIIDWSVDYLNVILIGIGGMAFFNILSGIMRGLGDSTSPLLYLIFSTIMNIILDLLFVAVFNMGVAGVAIATVIAQVLASLLCLRKIFKMNDVFDFSLKDLKINKQHLYAVTKLGLPSGFTQMVFSLAMVIIQPLTNSFGELLIAANVIVMRVDGFAMMPNFSFGTAMTTYVGQNYGANNFKRIEEGTKKGTLLALGTSLVITCMILLFGRNLVEIFTNTEELIELSVQVLKILAVGYLAMAVTQSLSGAMRGMGNTTTPMWISIFTTVIVRVPIAYLLVELTKTVDAPLGNPLVLFYSLVISWVAGALITTIAYIRYKRKIDRKRLAQ